MKRMLLTLMALAALGAQVATAAADDQTPSKEPSDRTVYVTPEGFDPSDPFFPYRFADRYNP